MDGGFQIEENQGNETRMDPVNPNESDGGQNESERSTVNSLEKETENIERAIIVHSGSEQQLGKGKGTLDVIAKLNPVEEHCQFVLKSAWNNMSTKMDIFDEWTHFHREVEKLFNENLAKFKLDSPSENHDYQCIRRLNDELKEIATLHRAQLALAGLPIMAPEAPFAGLHDSEAVKSQDHQAHENEPSVQVEHKALDDEHQAHCAHNSLDAPQEQQGSGGNPTQIEDPSLHIVDIANNPGLILFLTSMDPSPSNLRMITYTPDSEEDTRLSFLKAQNLPHRFSTDVYIQPPRQPSS
ncbi:hypothetical protein F511_13323 [Dorcoceras hygrometricum]|uniref:Uncharacterized protein n=1 Tax=Dorcoceras hygrometricum TaxID=472368 RepID=A0A2Z7DD73_9LAMI|nr:hypothetical protein F511_13323 [Dorcoceras hygrometricum]